MFARYQVNSQQPSNGQPQQSQVLSSSQTKPQVQVLNSQTAINNPNTFQIKSALSGTKNPTYQHHDDHPDFTDDSASNSRAIQKQDRQSKIQNLQNTQNLGGNSINQSGQVQLHISVIGLEEIEAPWREECQYLQSMILELQNNPRIEIQKEYVQVENKDKLNEYENQIQQLNDKLNQQTNDINNLRGQLDTRQREIQTLKLQISDQDTTINQLRAQLFQKTRDCDSLKQQCDDWQNQVTQFKAQYETKNRECETLRNQNRELESLVQELTNKNEQLSRENDLLKRQKRDQEIENSKLTTQLEQRQKEYDELRIQNKQQEQIINELRSRLNDVTNSKDAEIESLKQRIYELESQGTQVITERVTTLTQEVDVWKQRFIKVNHEYNHAQEGLIMAQAELESLKKSAKREVTMSSKTTTVSSSQKSQVSTNPRPSIIQPRDSNYQ